jgi:hypothetical protein
VLYPTTIGAMSLHWDLISQWKANAEQHPVTLDGMLAGNGTKMLMPALVGWVLVTAMYLFWLLVFSPAVYLFGRKKGRAQLPLSDMPPSGSLSAFSGPRAVAGGAMVALTPFRVNPQ